MDDLISRQAALEAIKHAELGAEYGAVAALPTIEERKTGHRIRTSQACYEGGSITEFECSACHDSEIMQSNYCPNCGAYMRGEEHEG